jgi:hypothetical protein
MGVRTARMISGHALILVKGLSDMVTNSFGLLNQAQTLLLR